MPLLSVIVPVYNSSDSLSKNISSILNQSFVDFELIIVNDGSTDDSESIINGFSDNRITYIKTKNKGVSNARNIGINKAKGDYIIFLDSDDYIDKDMFKILISNSLKYSVDLIICGYYSETIHGVSHIYFKPFKKYKSLSSFSSDIVSLYENCLFNNVWNKLYNREIIVNNKLKFPNMSYGEDNIFNQNYVRCSSSFLVIENCLYHYVREQKNSVTSNYVKNLFNIRLSENKLYIKFFNSLNISNYNTFLSKWFIERSIGCLENVHRSNLGFSKKYKLIYNIIKNNDTKKYLKVYKTKNLFFKIILFFYRCTFICYVIGWSLHFYRKHFPAYFNMLKNKR